MTIEPKEEEWIRLELESYVIKNLEIEKQEISESASANAKTRWTDKLEEFKIDNDFSDNEVGEECDDSVDGTAINLVKTNEFSLIALHKCKPVIPDIKYSKQDSGRKDMHLKFCKHAFKNAQPFLSAQKQRSKTKRILTKTPNKTTAYGLL